VKTFSNIQLVFIFFGGLVLLFIVAPLAGMFLATSFSDFSETIKDKEVTNSIFLTLSVSFCSTLVFAFFGIPLAYILAKKTLPFKTLINGIIDLPIVIPHSAAGIAILGFISRDSIVGKIGTNFGFDFVGHPAGIALAMAFVSVPFLIHSAKDGFAAVPEKYEKAALNLGASPTRVFFSISLPLAWKNIVSGLVLMFARGMSEFGAVVIVAYHPMITPVLIFERFGAFGLKYARPVSVVFILVCLVFFILFGWLSKYKKDAGN